MPGDPVRGALLASTLLGGASLGALLVKGEIALPAMAGAWCCANLAHVLRNRQERRQGAVMKPAPEEPELAPWGETDRDTPPIEEIFSRWYALPRDDRPPFWDYLRAARDKSARIPPGTVER